MNYKFPLAIFVSTVFISGCAFDETLKKTGDSFTGALTSESPQVDLSSVSPVALRIPNDQGIQKRQAASYSTVIVRDVGYDSRVATIIHDAKYHRLMYENLTPSSFVVHARTDNGVAGSGAKYGVSFNVEESPSGYQVKFRPTTYNTYQEGLIGKFPVPNFSPADLRDQLTSLQIVYKFEIDSSYNTESVTANFIRKAKAVPARQGWADSVTGKIYSSYFVSKLRETDVLYVVQVYPYRNGSKAVITATIPGIETSDGVVDYGVLIGEVKKMLQEIAQS